MVSQTKLCFYSRNRSRSSQDLRLSWVANCKSSASLYT